jgi:hypothetical protein
MVYDIIKIPSELSGLLDKPSLLLHVSFERVIAKMYRKYSKTLKI